MQVLSAMQRHLLNVFHLIFHLLSAWECLFLGAMPRLSKAGSSPLQLHLTQAPRVDWKGLGFDGFYQLA